MDDDPERGRIELDVMNALRTIYDPEIPVDIWNLGLIYGVTVTPDHDVEIQMTLTAPACPAAEMLPPEVEQKAAAVPGNVARKSVAASRKRSNSSSSK